MAMGFTNVVHYTGQVDPSGRSASEAPRERAKETRKEALRASTGKRGDHVGAQEGEEERTDAVASAGSTTRWRKKRMRSKGKKSAC